MEQSDQNVKVKNGNIWKTSTIVLIVILVMSLVLTGLSAKQSYDNEQILKNTESQLNDAKKELDGLKSGDDKEETDGNDSSNDTKISLDSASFILPKPWEAYSDTYTADRLCEEEGDLTMTDIRCVKAVSLIPGEKLSDYKDNDEYFRVNIQLYHNDPSRYSLSDIIEKVYGIGTDGVVDSSEDINGYRSYYRKFVSESYTDVDYIISANNKTNDFVIIHARIASKHYTQGKVDDEKDFTRFESDIKKIAESVSFND
ncbi:MAG: hypothetical protein LBM09_02805 [Candidatus Nomurabacteria bacterium]|jgi:hypothetical protein|nr:hypothetical protein [Candidatus Nomurabacteria bacterium]